MVERIKLILKTRGLSPSQFADDIQVQRSGVSHVLSRRNKPSLDFVMKILDTYAEIDPEWLLRGHGSMVRMPDQASNSKMPGIPSHSVSGEIQFPDLPVKNTIVEKPLKQATSARMKPGEIRDKEIERIVVFYRDMTFKEYHPE
jgi:transcriptional regulator with XRE-family HTH domain